MKIKILKKMVLILFSGAALSGIWAAPEPLPSSTHIAKCELISHGMSVGHGSITRKSIMRNNNLCTEVRLQIDTRVNLLVYKLDMKMDECWVSDASGLVAYNWKSTENGRTKEISGELRNGVFQFVIIEQGKKRVVSIPREDFDVAAIQCQVLPEQALREGESKEVRVLDPSTCTVVKRVYHGTGKKALTIDKTEVMCETVMIEEGNTHIERWFIEDALGPLILREDSDQKRGSYSRRVTSMGVSEKL